MFSHAPLVVYISPSERLGNRPGRGQQGLDKAAGLLPVELNLFLFRNQLMGSFQSVGDDKGGYRATFERGGAFEQSLVRFAHTRHKAMGLSFGRKRVHRLNVCLRGTRRKC